MIKSIEIKNFRCFKETKVSGFSSINLFGGMNNSGKTTLLEAIFININPSSDNIIFLHRIIRGEKLGIAKSKPEILWNNIFHQQNKKQEVLLNSIDKDNHECNTTIYCNEEYSDLIDFKKDIEDRIGINDANLLDELNSNLPSEKSKRSVLHINSSKNGKIYKNTLMASESGIIAKNNNSSNENINFITALQKLSNSSLAREYEKYIFDEGKSIILETFREIDPTIEDIEVFSFAEPTLYIKRKDENKMPIGLFGDAFNKIASFIIYMMNNPNSIILIDEIENGIHYSNHKNLWEMLFKLSKKHKIQIFSTSHSLEMIRAFSEVSEKYHEEDSSYFEVAKNKKTGLIKGFKHDAKTLSFELKNGITFRGE